MRKTVIAHLALAVALIIQKDAFSIGTQVYTSRTQWAEAVGSLVETEDFNSLAHGQLPAGLNHLGKIDFYNDCLSGNLIADQTYGGTPVNGTTCLRIEASRQNGSNPPFSPELVFRQPVWGFGGDWYYGSNGTLTVGGQTFKFADYLLPPNRKGFLGFVTDTPLSSAEFYTVIPFNMLVYVDDLSFAPVPEPSTLALLGMGIFGLLAWAWRRSCKAV
jgi:hypothetical protein